jgi:hypothetical protein
MDIDIHNIETLLNKEKKNPCDDATIASLSESKAKFSRYAARYDNYFSLRNWYNDGDVRIERGVVK